MENNWIYVKQSNIPNSGDGCFAKMFIPSGTKIGKYKGKYITAENIKELSSYYKERVLKINDDLAILSEGLTSKINDNIKFERYSKEEFTDAIIKAKLKRIDSPHNCKFVVDKRKAFIVSTQDINENEELYIDYGFDYWFDRLYIKGMLPARLVPASECDEKEEVLPAFNHTERFYH